MSAYIVEDATLHRILTALNTNRELEHACRHHLAPLGYAVDQGDDLDRLAGDLHILNCDAVDQRYTPGTSAHDTAGTSTLPRFIVAPCTPLRAYKALKCFLYQCSEGDVPQRPLYQAMRAIQHAMADQLVCSMPEYNAAKWG